MTHGYLLDVDDRDHSVYLRDYISKWYPRDSTSYSVLIAGRGQFSTGSLSTRKDIVQKIQYGHSNFLDTGLSYGSALKTTPEFRTLNPEKRECLFPDEKVLMFFPEYSEPSCMLECAWNRARDKCGCVPWFLGEHYPDSPMCEVRGNACFKIIIDERYENAPDGCDEVTCPADCQHAEVSFETTEGDWMEYGQVCTEHIKASEEEKIIACGHFNEKYSFLGQGAYTGQVFNFLN